MFYFMDSLCNDQVLRYCAEFCILLARKCSLGSVFLVNDVLSHFTLLLRNGKLRLAKFDNLALHT